MPAPQPNDQHRTSSIALIQRLTDLARELKRFDMASKIDARSAKPPVVPPLTPTGTREMDSIANTVRAAMHVYERHAERLRAGASESASLRVDATDPVVHRVTVLSCEVTRLRSSIMQGDPSDALRTLGRHLTLAGHIVRLSGGMLHTVNATSLLGIFGMTEDDRTRHAIDACECGLKLLSGVDQFNSWQRKHGEAPIRCSIGIHTGHVIIGNISADTQALTGIIGLPVQVATHLHILADAQVRPLLVSSTTADLVADELDSTACGETEVAIDGEHSSAFAIDAPPPHVDYRDLLNELFPAEPEPGEDDAPDTP
jgi:class 3 adenylate cyclase